MQEFEVTYAGVTYPLERPFFILATQNPIEQAGTFPLPEAQLDRFLLYIKVGYPTAEEEKSILENTTGKRGEAIHKVIEGSKILEAQKLVRDVHINKDLIEWVSSIVRATRSGTSDVKYVNDIREYDVPHEGYTIRNSAPFVREGINVNFVETVNDHTIFVRTFERGVEAETWSCGTGVTAAALVSAHNETGFNQVDVETLGGKLSVEYDRVSEGEYRNIWLIGPAEYVFEGHINLKKLIAIS
ncbi:MAG: hypothetical protein EAZ17_00960 [Sphingobacteriales bacterium]|nr:MAG: hypothetical protein EAZ17_00960 [Sphingobacteriales bacterium]